MNRLNPSSQFIVVRFAAIVSLFSIQGGPSVRLSPSPTPAAQDSIVATSVAVLGGADEQSRFISIPRAIVRLKDGRYVAAVNPETSLVVFDKEGQRIGNYSLKGGHAEELVMARSDSVYAYDAEAGEVIVVGKTGEIVGHVRLNHGLGAISEGHLLPTVGFVFAAPAHFADIIGFPVHHFNFKGEYQNSFGSTTQEYRPDEMLLYRRFIAPVGDTMVWLVNPVVYGAELWGVDGRLRRRLAISANWFPAYAKPARTPERPPLTTISTIAFGGRGYLWLVSRIPDPKWHKVWEQYEASGGKIENADLYWDSIVQVIDTQTSKCVAQARFDQAFISFIGGGRIYSESQDAAG